ncbi:MAG: diadenylate cyclase CdaA [Dysgonamonadaceae bacterium]|nr:diadenylate cyclase CdaA [Dysgonamonadaceae bacterium]
MPFNFGIKDIIDVALVVFFLYETYLLMKKNGTTSIFLAIFSFIILWLLVSKVLKMNLLGAIFDQFVNVGLIVIVVVFQKEIREFLQSFGSNKVMQFIMKLFTPKRNAEIEEDISYIMPIVLATINMAKRKEGALIAIQQKVSLDTFVRTGEILNANISARLIENIFFKNSPLHDGCMIIVDKKIKAAGCILPVSQDRHLPKRLGLRHRSGLGLSQETDAKVIIVSEQTGKISLAYRGKIHAGISAEELQKNLIEKE